MAGYDKLHKQPAVKGKNWIRRKFIMYLWKKLEKGAAIAMAVMLCLTGCQSAVPAGEDDTGSARGEQSSQNGQGVQIAGNTGNGDGAMGRYMEQQVNLPGEVFSPIGLLEQGGSIRLAVRSGGDFLSTDFGGSFVRGIVQETLRGRVETENVFDLAAAPDGSRLAVFMELAGEEVEHHLELFDAEGNSKPVEGVSPEYVPTLFYGGDGAFYAVERGGVYRIDAMTGESAYLFTPDGNPIYTDVCGKYMFMQESNESGYYLAMYDLETGGYAETDTVLEKFLAENMDYSDTPYLLCAAERGEAVYVLTRKGLYYHVLYGDAMEQLIDGALNSMGNLKRTLVDMMVLPGDGSTEFLVLFNDFTGDAATGVLCRYVYDENVPTVPDTLLRVWGLYEEEDIEILVSAFVASHPDLYVRYETGVAKDSGVTREDALRNLSTELAAGTGPDVILMDDMPYASYVEKGVLTDLTELLEEFKGASGESLLFENIARGMEREGGLYAVPMTFSYLVMMGGQEVLKAVSTLEDLAVCMEELRAKQPEGNLAGFMDAESALEVLSIASSGAWQREDGSLNSEALTEFLTLAKRIYDAQMTGLDQQTREFVMQMYGDNRLAASELQNLSIDYRCKGSIGMGRIQGRVVIFAGTAAMLDAMGWDLAQMPGQAGNVCTPSGLLGINQASPRMALAEEFVRFALSEDFQKTANFNGAAVNRAAYLALQAEPQEGYFAAMGMEGMDGEMMILDINWPGEAELNKLLQLAENCGVNYCDSQIYEAVMELGQSALTGEKNVGEAVNEIEDKVRLYLAE